MQGFLTMSFVGCRVLRAFPVQELPGEGGSIDVEMDPVDEAAVRAAIQEQHGMRCGTPLQRRAV
jgi:hypothetical protein